MPLSNRAIVEALVRLADAGVDATVVEHLAASLDVGLQGAQIVSLGGSGVEQRLLALVEFDARWQGRADGV